MTGRGKGGKGLGKAGAKRHQKTTGSSEIGKPSIRRLCRKAGVKRISGKIYEDVRAIMEEEMTTIIGHALTYAQYRAVKTVKTTDIVMAARRQGSVMAGFATAPRKLKKLKK